MDYGFQGIPFVNTAKDQTVIIQSMDYAFEGIPFVANSITAVVTTEIELATESITIIETTSAFDTTCPLVEGITVADSYFRYNSISGLVEIVTISDSMGVLNVICTLPSEDIAVTDDLSASPIIPLSASDSILFIDDEVYWTLPQIISEILNISDISYGSPIQFNTLIETLFVYDELKNGWKVTAESSLILTDTIQTILGIIVDEWINFIDIQSNNWNGREIISEDVTLYDIAKLAKIYADSLSDELHIADVSTYGLTITVLEYLGFTDLANAMRTSVAAINDSINIVDNPALEFPLSVESILSVVDLSTVAVQFLNSAQSALGLADVSSLIKRISDTVTDPIVFVDTITSHAHLYSLIYDTLALNVIIELDGEVWECYVLNTPKFHPSMYSGFNFNSFCVFENRAFGANDTGIYELTGETDAGSPIHTGVILSETNFNSPNQKRMRRGYLDISGTSPKMILETGEGQRQAYAIDEQGKMVASHELKSKSWKLSIAEFETLGSLKLIPIILTK
jgi:hypothetical protein